jgi:phthalate 4,5-dioxygenase oxygenase subunit
VGHPANTPDTEAWRTFLCQRVGSTSTNLSTAAQPENHFWQDRHAMKDGNFTGITGFRTRHRDVVTGIDRQPHA